jgi:hypothetical protein
MNMISELNSFVSFNELVENLTKALIDKSMFKWKSPQDFNLLYEALVNLANEEQTLEVIVTLGRVEATLKKPLFNLDKASGLLAVEPDLATLKEGDDRYYAARFIKRLGPSWIDLWAFKNVWSESGGEKARLVFVETIFDNGTSLETILAGLGTAGQSYVKTNKLNEQKVVARSLRVLKAFRVVCQARELSCVLELGKAVDTFMGAPFSHFTPSKIKPNARKNLVPEVIELLLDLIGQRFSLAIVSEHYTVLERLRKWCSAEVWLDLSNRNPALKKLSNTISEALVILARQGITDGELLRRLRDSVESNNQFNIHCQQIAETPHLDESITAWLMAGGERQQVKKTISSEGVVSAKGEATDLGDLLLRVQQGQVAVKVAEETLDELELFDPSLIPIIKDLVNHWARVSEVTDKLARKRRVKLLGGLGETIDIDRKLFDVVEEGEINNRRGTVVRSAVIESANGRSQVIKKGIVKAKEE